MQTWIDVEKCCNDKLCIKICPLKLYSFSDGKVTMDKRFDDKCIGCGQCTAVCPKDAINLKSVDPASLETCTNKVDFDLAKDFIKSRRSVRHFAKEPIPNDIVLQALDVARHAPSAYNKQPTKWLVISDQEKIQGLAKLTADILRATRKTFFTRLADVYDNGYDVMLRHAPQLVIAYGKTGDEILPCDCSSALTYLELSLHSMGYGTCWMGYVQRAAHRSPEISNYLGMPYEYNLIAGLMIGKPIYKYRRVPARKPLDVTFMD